ncbi:hypothetical protein DH2020_000082 [Rehmannia glutinosa]|uniref:R2R3-MYB protein n=1 Tax=Rehmannia glutinosa TaxID=99300 RepID=A0ABR0XVG9_REHGL
MENEDDVRKGPWTEQEDVQLVFYVNLFGDRRWDFIAKVSGLKRTGKSCRWSRIARKIPGRTDNEIKNYWRTHMRKKAQEKKKAINNSQSPSSSYSNSSSSSNSNYSPTVEFNKTQVSETKGRSFYDTGGMDSVAAAAPGKSKTGLAVAESADEVYSMDEIWKDIELSEDSSKLTSQKMPSPLWDFFPTEEESINMVDHFHSFPFTII